MLCGQFWSDPQGPCHVQNRLLCSCHSYHLQSKKASSTRGSESFCLILMCCHATLTSMINVHPCNSDLCSSLKKVSLPGTEDAAEAKSLSKQTKCKMKRFQKTKNISALSLGRAGWKRRGWPSLGWQVFIPLWAGIPEVEVVFPDVGDDSIWEQVLHALPPAQGPPDVCGADLVLHRLPGQVDLVLVSMQDGWVQDISLGVMPCSGHTHQAKLLHYFLDVCVFPEVGGLEGLEDICPAEELQLRHSWKNKGGSQESNRRVMARKDSVIFCLRFSPNGFLGIYGELNVYVFMT